MSNFAKKLEDATEEELKHWIMELDPHIVPLASDELTRRTLKNLQEAIEKFNQQSSKYSKILIWLTAIMTIAVGIQIYLLLK